MTTTPNKWTFWFFWIAGNALAWGLGFAAGFAFYWWMGERNSTTTIALPMIVIVLGFQWGILRYLTRGHPAYTLRPEKYVPVGPSFVVAPLAIYSFSIWMMSNDVTWVIFLSLSISLIFINSFIRAEFFTHQRSPWDNDIHPNKAIGTLVLFVILGVLGWQFGKLLFIQSEASSNEFALWMERNLLLGSILGLIYSVFSVWGLKTLWDYEALGEDIFFNIDGKAVLKDRRQSRWQGAGFFVLLLGWNVWVALQPCNGLDRTLGISGCIEQIRNIGERRLGLATMSLDGKWLTYTFEGSNFTEGQITLWDLEEHRPAWVANLPNGLGTLSGSPEFSPDGNLLAFLSPPYYDENDLTTQIWHLEDGQFVETITRSNLPREIALTPSGENTFTFDLSAQQLWDWSLRNQVILQGPNFELTVHRIGSGPDRWFIMGKVADNWQTWQVKNGLLSQVDTIESKESEMFEQIRQTLPTEYVENNLFLPSGKDYYILQTNRAFQLWHLPSP